MFARLVVLAVSCMTGVCACSADRTLSRAKLSPESVRDGERIRAKGPKIPDQPGKEAVREYVQACYEDALTYNETFRKGGEMVVQWFADRDGDLLRMQFTRDSFSDWEMNDAGDTLADCVVKRAQERKVQWSRQGLAPLRLSPPDEME
jgi:hypothetical protein